MKRKILIFLLIILLLGLFLRVYGINSRSLWHDEVVYMEVSKNFFNYIPYYIFYKDGYYKDFSSPLYNQYTNDNLGLAALPFYHFVMNIWIDIFGISETALRLFSAICGVLSILFIFLIAKYLFNDKIALLSSFLFSINPYNIFFSQDATFYTLVVLLALLSVYYFIKLLKENKNKNWIFYAVFSALGIYTHYFFLFLIFFQWIFFILFIKKHKHLIKNFVLSQILIFVLYLPFLPHFYYQSIFADKYFWLDVFNWIDVPSVLVVFGIGQTLIRKQSSLYLILPVLFFYFIGFIIPFLIGLFKKKSIKKNIFLFLYLFIPIITPVILSVISRPIFQWKYVMLASPAFIILIAKGLTNVKKKLYYFFLIIIIILSFSSLIHYYTTPIFKGDWREASKYIEQHEIPGDLIIVHSPQVVDTLKYYYRGELPIKWFPYIPFEQLDEKNIKVTEKNIRNIDSVIKDYKRVWLVQRLVVDKEQTIPNYLDKKYKRLYFNKFVWVRVYLYQLN